MTELRDVLKYALFLFLIILSEIKNSLSLPSLYKNSILNLDKTTIISIKLVVKTENREIPSEYNLKEYIMEVMHKPELMPLEIGDSIKTLQVKGLAGMIMPPHHSTKEAVIVVQEGQALLKMPGSDHLLKKGTTFIVPAGKEHTLTIQKDFKAIAIMAIDSQIIFI